jgi:methylated-DNA-[protein]-cysteine S-methyltransferase
MALMKQSEIGCCVIPSRFGETTLVWRETENGPRVVEIVLPLKRAETADIPAARPRRPALDGLCQSIERYLDGENVELPTDLLDFGSCSPFQQTVLLAERTIPRGRVASYSRLAHHIGHPKAARAVGTALARNPFPIVIPCHRTLRNDGSLGGFGGGLDMKRALLEMEGVAFDQHGRVKLEFLWDFRARV